MGGEPPPWRGHWNLELKGPGRRWTGEACSKREVSGRQWSWGPGWEGLLSCARNLAPEQQRLWETPPPPALGLLSGRKAPSYAHAWWVTRWNCVPQTVSTWTSEGTLTWKEGQWGEIKSG